MKIIQKNVAVPRLAFLAAVWLYLPATALADTTLTVTNADDDLLSAPSGSLREAIAWVNSNVGTDPVTIVFNTNLIGATIHLSGELGLQDLPPGQQQTLHIVGLGPRQLSIVDANGRVLEVPANWNVSISDLTMTGQVKGDDGSDGSIGTGGSLYHPDGYSGQDVTGGGISIASMGHLSLTNCVMQNCCAIGGKGGAGCGSFVSDFLPALFAYPPGSGGAGGAAGGGAINNDGSLDLCGCYFYSNSATGGNGGWGGSSLSWAGPRPFPGGDGGPGGDAWGGAIYTDASCGAFAGYRMANCTFYTNRATGGDGGYGGNSGPPDAVVRGRGGDGGNGGHAYGGAASVSGGCTLPTCGPRSCTINGNNAVGGQQGQGGQGAPNGSPGSEGDGNGGGMYFSGEEHFQNVIIAGNFAADDPNLYASPVVSEGYNLIGDASGVNWSLNTGDQLNVDPRLASPPADNGGPTPTLALLADSPAIDQGYSGGLTTDQREYPRPYNYYHGTHPEGGDYSDIGAFELQPMSDLATSFDLDLPPGYSLLAFPLVTDNRVSVLFSGVSLDGFSIFKIDQNGLTANNCLDGNWTDPDMTLSPGEAWFFKNPYATTYTLHREGLAPTGVLSRSLPPGISACSSPAMIAGRLQTDLKFPVPSSGTTEVDVLLWNGNGWESYYYVDGVWEDVLGNLSEPVIPTGHSFCVHNYNGGLDWVQEVDSFGVLLRGNGIPNTQSPWPAQEGLLNFLTYNVDAPAAHRVYDADGTTPLNSDYAGQLYGGTSPDQSTFIPLGRAPVQFPAGAYAGYLCSGAVTVPGTFSGQTVYAQLRCWRQADGASFEAAMANGGAVGVSAAMILTAGGLSGFRPPDANTFPSFQLLAQHRWNNGSGKWETAGNWLAAVAPSTDDPAEYIANDGTKTVTIDATTSGSYPGTMTNNNIILSNPGNTLSLTDAGYIVPLHVLNDFHILAGATFLNSDSWLLVDGSHSFTVDGTALFTNALFSAANVTIAKAGPGTFTLSGGTAQIGQLWIGYGDVGRLTNNGAALIVSNLVLGGLRGSDGTLVMTGGSISSSNGLTVAVGQDGAGALILDDGMVTATCVLLTNGPNSVLQLGGGVLNSSNITIGSGAILSGNGTVAGPVINAGTILATGPALTFTGPFTNNGTILAMNGALISFSGPVVNNGTIQFSEGRAQFASTFQNNGTVLPPAPSPGCALSFDGIDDYVCVPGFLTNAPTSEVTVEFWEKANVVALQAPFCQSAFVNGSIFAAYLPCGNGGNGTVYWEFGNIKTEGYLTYDLTNSIVGAWQHFAFVASQSNNYMRIYMNGALVASKTNMTPLVPANLDLCLGGCAGAPFNGLLDEFRIWNVARSQADIQSTMHSSLTGFEPGLVAYWPMNECGGTNVYDAAGPSAHTGAVVNGTSWTNSDIPFVPTVLTLPPMSLGTNSVTLAAAFNPNGLTTTAWFQWGTSTNYENATTANYLGGRSPVMLTNIIISGLAPGVTYYYRAAGSNTAGVNYGADFSLEIPVLPAPLLLSIAQTGTNVTLSWPGAGLDFVLEQTGDLCTTNWATANILSMFVGTNITVTCPLGPSNVFYRLRSP